MHLLAGVEVNMHIVQFTNMLPKTARLKLIFLHRGLNEALDSCQEMSMDTSSV